MSTDDAFSSLVGVIDRLLAPDGCPWDRAQTMRALSHMVFEEVCEIVDAVREGGVEQCADELGDLFIGAVFLAKAAEREGLFDWKVPFERAVRKLIRRHPHVFGEGEELLTADDVAHRWDEIKAKEASHVHRKSRFDGIPSALPALAMMQKLMGKARKWPEGALHLSEMLGCVEDDHALEIGRRIAQIVQEADRHGISAEDALRGYCLMSRKVLTEKEQSACS